MHLFLPESHIITLIFYYGESPWDGPVTLSGMMTDIPEELRPFFSDYKINLVQILDSGHYQFYNEDVRSVFDITKNKIKQEHVTLH